MRILVFLALVACCGPNFVEPPPGPTKFADQVALGHIVPAETSTWLLTHSAFEDIFKVEVPNLLTEPSPKTRGLQVWWVDQPCPTNLDRNAVNTPSGCYAGVMYGCAKIYVATNQKAPDIVCGTELVHEYLHCLSALAFDDVDGGHTDCGVWGTYHPECSPGLLDELKESVCALGW